MTRTLFASGAGDGALGVVLFVSEEAGRAYTAFCALFLAPEAFRPRAVLRVMSQQEPQGRHQGHVKLEPAKLEE